MNIVVITGASSGMGREFAMQLDRGLHSVDEFWLIARRGSRLKEIASGMQHTVKILPLDLTNEADMTVLTESLAEEKPVVRMLINCAGYGMMGDYGGSDQRTDRRSRFKLSGAFGSNLWMSALYAGQEPDHSAGEQCGILPQPGFPSTRRQNRSF